MAGEKREWQIRGTNGRWEERMAKERNGWQGERIIWQMRGTNGRESGESGKQEWMAGERNDNIQIYKMWRKQINKKEWQAKRKRDMASNIINGKWKERIMGEWKDGRQICKMALEKEGQVSRRDDI